MHHQTIIFDIDKNTSFFVRRENNSIQIEFHEINLKFNSSDDLVSNQKLINKNYLKIFSDEYLKDKRIGHFSAIYEDTVSDVIMKKAVFNNFLNYIESSSNDNLKNLQFSIVIEKYKSKKSEGTFEVKRFSIYYQKNIF